mgnify:CR=1 FL=1
MPRVVVIGRRANVLPFRAVGVEIQEAEDAAAARELLRDLCKETEPCLVMMTEDLLAECGDEATRFRGGKWRAIVAIPALDAPPGRQRDKVRHLITRALGVDLLGRASKNSNG